MDALRILEEKIITLVSLIQDLKSKNNELETQTATLKQQLDELVTNNNKLETENARLSEENFQLVASLGNLETSVAHDSETIDLLKEEKALTKIAVDDLIKSISDLVATEQQ
jgi:peptidoglycan hydrolase CwlO-like protein